MTATAPPPLLAVFDMKTVMDTVAVALAVSNRPPPSLCGGQTMGKCNGHGRRGFAFEHLIMVGSN